MPKPNAAMIKQISAEHRKRVQRILKREHGELSREEYFRFNQKKWKTEIDKYAGKPLYEVLLHNLKTHSGCTEDEAAAMAIARLYSFELLERAVARRIVYGDLADLECALSLGTRLHWLEGCFPGRRSDDRYPDVWFVLQGLAASDVEVARAIFGDRPRALSGGHTPTVLIYNAVQAIVTQDAKLQKRSLAEIKHPIAHERYQAILDTLCAIMTADATTVAAGLDRVLATFHKLELFEHEKIIAIIAHGLAELAYWVAPALLAEFDVDRGLPWDREYYHWLRRPRRPRKPRWIAARSPLLRRWIEGFEEPGWWRR